jgi:hypothetical protein
MDHLTAAQILGVAEYTIVTHTFDAERDGWVVNVRDMASHTETERFIDAEQVAHIYPRPAVETAVEEDAAPADEAPHGVALVELAEDAAVPDGTVPEVLEWVGASPERAYAALVVETERDKPRKTLTDALQSILDTANAAGA